MSFDPDLSRLSAPPPSLNRDSSEKQTSKWTQGASSLERSSAGSDLTKESLRAHLQKLSPNLQRHSVQRSQAEIDRRKEIPMKVTVSLLMSEGNSGSHVYYKFDGTRFGHADATIKVVSGSSYEWTLSIEPFLDLDQGLLQVRGTPTGEVPSVSVVSFRKKSPTKLGGSWKCDFQPSGKSKRVDLVLSGELIDFGPFSIPLMLKVYDSSERGANQGFKMKMAIVDLKSNAAGRTPSVRYLS